jgi:predicted PurR-regulated permease PerM
MAIPEAPLPHFLDAPLRADYTRRVTQTHRLILLGLFVVALYLLYLVLRPLLGGIVWAVVLVVAFQPLYQRLVRILGGREWPAAILVSLLIALMIVLPISLAAMRLAKSIGRAYQFIAARAAAGSPDPLHQLFDLLDQVRVFMGQYIDVSDLDFKESLLDGLDKLGTAISAGSGALLGNAASALLTVSVMLVTMVFLLKESSRILSEVRRSLPLTEEDKEKVVQEFRSVVRAVFYGVMLTAVIQGMLGGIGCAIAGLPAPFTLGAAMFFCALLPIGGTMLVWLPAGLYLIFTQHTVAGIFLLAWGAGVVSLMDNFLRPIFIGGRTRMHLLLVSFGIFGGLSAFGLVGLFVGPLVIALFLALLDVIRREFKEPPRVGTEKAEAT